MADARQRSDWQHTASLLAGLANGNPFRKGPAAQPRDFDPFSAAKAAPAKPLSMAQLFGLVTGKPDLVFPKPPEEPCKPESPPTSASTASSPPGP